MSQHVRNRHGEDRCMHIQIGAVIGAVRRCPNHGDAPSSRGQGVMCARHDQITEKSTVRHTVHPVWQVVDVGWLVCVRGVFVRLSQNEFGRRVRQRGESSGQALQSQVPSTREPLGCQLGSLLHCSSIPSLPELIGDRPCSQQEQLWCLYRFW